MSLNWRSVTGNFVDYLYNFLVPLEASTAIKRQQPSRNETSRRTECPA